MYIGQDTIETFHIVGQQIQHLAYRCITQSCMTQTQCLPIEHAAQSYAQMPSIQGCRVTTENTEADIRATAYN